MKYVGLGKEASDKWYQINILLYDRMLKVSLYTEKCKRPKIYLYNKEKFQHCMNEMKNIDLKWFIGIILK